MSKSPHMPEFRTMVSQEYPDGLACHYFLVNKYNLYNFSAFQNRTPPIHLISKQCEWKLFCLEKEVLIDIVLNIILQADRFCETEFHRIIKIKNLRITI